MPKSSRPTSSNSFLFTFSIAALGPEGEGGGFDSPSLTTLTTSPLALSRFLRRARDGACKNRSAAPASARLFRPLDAPGQSCPGPRQGSRVVQKPKKHCHAWPVETFRASNGGTGVFLNGFCPPLRLVPHARFGGQPSRPRPVDETGRRGWLRSRGAACGRNSRGGAGAAVCFLRGRDDARSKNRAPQPGAVLQFSQGRTAARWENWLSTRGKPSTSPVKNTNRNPRLFWRSGGFVVVFQGVPIEKISLHKILDSPGRRPGAF